jgi:N-acetylmuramoyl-L-alanine amidase
MVKRTLALVLAATAVAATPPVRTMYVDATAKEQAVRKALANPAATDVMLNAVHEAIATYEAVVRRYPASSYSDNALWQAAHLAIDAYAKFSQPADRDTAARLLKRLAASYPSSTLIKQIPELLAKLEAPAAPAATPRAALTPPVSPPQSTAPAPTPTTTPTPTRAPAASTSATAPPDRVATIKNIRRTVLPDAVRVVIELDAEVPFRQERIPDPSRVFLDLPGTRPAPSLLDQTIRFQSDADIVRQVRLGRHPNNTTRVVLDAAGVSSYSVYPLYDPYRLVIDCVRDSGAAAAAASAAPAIPLPSRQFAKTPAVVVARREPPPLIEPPALPPPLPPIVIKREPIPLIARRTGTGMLRSAPSNAPKHGMLIAEAREPVPEPIVAPLVSHTTPFAAHTPPPAPMSSPPTGPVPKAADSPSATAPRSAPSPTGGLSIARQLGLGVSRIVIDPGHGGHDSGAKGKSGIVESELVLDIALRVEKMLQNVGGVEVILTRRTDDFIELPERTAIANREGADLFLSIHANASTSSLAHGIETYFLNFATNVSAAAVAARENANSTQAMGALPDFVKAIALNDKVDESRDLATHVQAAMLDRLRPANKTVKDLGVKQAPFVVLIGAVMPSVLAEISFVTNPQEARLLKGDAYRQKIAEALFEGVRKYQLSLKAMTTVATQR